MGCLATVTRLRLTVAVTLACATGVSLAPAPAPATNSSAAAALTLTRARTAAYSLARSVGAQEGAVYAVAGFCKRRSSSHVNCWAGIVFANYDAAAQRVSVTRVGRRVRARRFGRIYTGNIGQKQSSQSGGEWAICGIHSSVCIGS
jgi:hypothetical protein